MRNGRPGRVCGINHLTLAVSDLGRSFDFYVGLLDCTPKARWDSGVYLSTGGTWLCLALGPVDRSDDYTHIAFGVTAGGFGECAARLHEAGVTIWQPDSSEGDSLYFLDPDGHRLELHDGDLASRLAAVDAAPYAGWTRRFAEPATLRAARAGDVPAIRRCARAAYAPYVERIGREPAPMLADFAAHVAAGEVHVAAIDDEVVGYVVARRFEHTMLLENVAVLPGQGGRGTGRRLIDRVEHEALVEGASTVFLYTDVAMHENIILYRRLGYRETARRREDGFERVYFEKRLDGEDMRT